MTHDEQNQVHTVMKVADGETIAAAGVNSAQVEHQRQLRSAVAHAMATTAGPAPAELVNAIRSQMSDRKPAQYQSLRQSALRSLIAAGAIAAVVALLAWPAASRNPGPLPSDLTQRLMVMHNICTHLNDHHYAGYGVTLDDISQKLQADRTCSTPIPNLNDLGFQYHGTQPCPLPGGPTAHVVYQSENDHNIGISLAIQPNAGQLDASLSRRPYLIELQGDKTLVAWQTKETVFYLSGPPDAVEIAASRLGMPELRLPRSAISQR